jgi:hypothetical protein
MLNPVEVDYFGKEDRERVARQVKQFRARPKNEGGVENRSVLLKACLTVASTLALFFGGQERQRLA